MKWGNGDRFLISALPIVPFLKLCTEFVYWVENLVSIFFDDIVRYIGYSSLTVKLLDHQLEFWLIDPEIHV